MTLGLLLLLASVASAQLMMIPPVVNHGVVNLTGTFVFQDSGDKRTYFVTAKFFYDENYGQATRLEVDMGADAGNQVITSWVRYLNTNPVLLEAFIEGKDPKAPGLDNCQELIFSDETLQCNDWQNMGNITVEGQQVVKWHRACTFRGNDGPVGSFRFDVATDQFNLPATLFSSVTDENGGVSSTLTLTRKTRNTQKPSQDTWLPPASCRGR